MDFITNLIKRPRSLLSDDGGDSNTEQKNNGNSQESSTTAGSSKTGKLSTAEDFENEINSKSLAEEFIELPGFFGRPVTLKGKVNVKENVEKQEPDSSKLEKMISSLSTSNELLEVEKINKRTSDEIETSEDFAKLGQDLTSSKELEKFIASLSEFSRLPEDDDVEAIPKNAGNQSDKVLSKMLPSFYGFDKFPETPTKNVPDGAHIDCKKVEQTSASSLSNAMKDTITKSNIAIGKVFDTTSATPIAPKDNMTEVYDNIGLKVCKKVDEIISTLTYSKPEPTKNIEANYLQEKTLSSSKTVECKELDIIDKEDLAEVVPGLELLPSLDPMPPLDSTEISKRVSEILADVISSDECHDTDLLNTDISKSLINQILEDVLTAVDIQNAKKSTENLMNQTFLENLPNNKTVSINSMEELLMEMDENVKESNINENDSNEKGEEMLQLTTLVTKGSNKLVSGSSPATGNKMVPPTCDILTDKITSTSIKDNEAVDASGLQLQFKGLSDFDESKIPRNLNANLKQQLKLAFDDDYPSLPESNSSNLNSPVGSLQEDQLTFPQNAEEKLTSEGETFKDCTASFPPECDLSEDDMKTALADTLQCLDDDLTEQDMKLSEDIEQLPLDYVEAEKLQENAADISYENMPMDIDMDCTQNLEENNELPSSNVAASLKEGSQIIINECPNNPFNDLGTDKSRLTFNVNRFENDSPNMNTQDVDKNKPRLTFNIQCEPSSDTKEVSPVSETLDKDSEGNIVSLVDSQKKEDFNKRLTFGVDSKPLPAVKLPEIGSAEITNEEITSRPLTPLVEAKAADSNLAVEVIPANSRPQTPNLETRFNSTLDMTASFTSARSSAANSPTFPTKEAVNSKLFPQSPSSKVPRKMSFLERSNLSGTSSNRNIPIVNVGPSEQESFNKVDDLASQPNLNTTRELTSRSVSPAEEALNSTFNNSITMELKNESFKGRRTFCVTPDPKPTEGAALKTFPLTSSIDLVDEEDKPVEKPDNPRRTFCINLENSHDSNPQLSKTIPNIGSSPMLEASERDSNRRRTFICSNTERENESNTAVQVSEVSQSELPDDVEPMDVDVSMRELPANNTMPLNEIPQILEIPQPYTNTNEERTASPPLPALQKRQAMEIPPAVDIRPLTCISPTLPSNKNLSIDIPENNTPFGDAPKSLDSSTKVLNADLNITSDVKAFENLRSSSPVPGLLQKGETFSLTGSNMIPCLSPPLPALQKQKDKSLETSDSKWSELAKPDVSDVRSSSPINALDVTGPVIKATNEGLPQVPSPSLPVMKKTSDPEIKKEENSSQSLPIMIKQEPPSTPEIQEEVNTFVSTSPPIPTLMKKEPFIPEQIPKPSTSPPLPVLQKRKSFDEFVDKQQSSPAQIAKIQKRRPLHPNQKQNIDVFRNPPKVDQGLSAKEKTSKDEKDIFDGTSYKTSSSLDEVFAFAKPSDPKTTFGNQNEFNSQEFDEEFKNSESNIILNPSDFEYLLTKGNNNVQVDPRSSLLLKFDPLASLPRLVNEPQQQQQQLQQILSNNKTNSALIETVAEEEEHHLKEQETEEKQKEKAKEEEQQQQQQEQGDLPKSRPNSGVKPWLKHKQALAKKNQDQEAAGAAAPGIELSSTTVVNKANTKKADAIMSADVIKDISIDSDSNKCFDTSNLQTDEKKLTYNMDELEKKIQNEVSKTEDIEKKLKESELREEALIKRITEKDKTINKMNGVIEAYEKAIAELISEKEQLTQNFERELAEVKADRDSYYHHLTSLETTFADLHIKYEKSKEMNSQLKANEEVLVSGQKQHIENLSLLEQRYDKMKNHAMQQLEVANKKLATLTKEHQMETTKLKALLKKEGIANASLNQQLEQKTRENAELVKICDELINEQQGS